MKSTGKKPNPPPPKVGDEIAQARKTKGTAGPLAGKSRQTDQDSLAQDAVGLFRTLLDHSSDSIEVLDPATGRFLDVNETECRALGYSRSELLAMSLFDVVPGIKRSRFKQVVQQLRSQESYTFEATHRRRDGTTFPVEVSGRLVRLEREYVISVARDISERKQAEEALLQSEMRFRALIENSWDGLTLVNGESTILYSSPSNERINGFSRREREGRSSLDLVHPDDRATLEGHLGQIAHLPGAVKLIEYRISTKDGKWKWIESIAHNLLDEPGVKAIVVNFRDITERKQAEATLRESEERFRSLSQAAFEGILIHENGIIQDANQVFAEMVGVHHPQELVGKNGMEVLPFTPESLESLRQSLGSDASDQPLELTVIRPDGTTYPAETQGRGIIVRGRSMRVVAMRDITARKQAEQALQEARGFLQQVVDSSPSMIFVLNARGQLVFANRYIADYYGTTPEALITKSTEEVHNRPGETKEFVSDDQQVALTRQPIVKDELNTSPNGEHHWFHTVKVPLVRPDGSVDILGIATDITDRKRAEEKIQRQLERLTALSEIDRTITSSFDVRLSLETLLNHLSQQLKADAADILLYDPGAQMLEYLTGRGFRTRVISNTPIHVGQGYAGGVIVARRMMKIADLKAHAPDPLREHFFTSEAFVSYCGVPLIAKGQIRGVLEVFQRSPLEPDRDWLDFLNALAEQAAIAIENATLFNNLQRSNSELGMAYDATIEGWSRALDLRDRETEGHTRRVTELTVQLGRAFHLSEPDLVQVRWGALLHDIGKMGVPDDVLFKPGPLIPEEWAIMKKHPVFAYEMLAPIHYLRAALDIPYLHHEKWDGTGYPLGLKGEQIPLAARIFAVADVWDALRSDRPYRPAWSVKMAREHIRSRAGTHFDPTVVDVFLESDYFRE